MSTIDKLINARCRLMINEPFYGHIAMNMVWIPSQMEWITDHDKTMGVRIVNGGEVQCLYYPPFVESLTIEELYAIVQHEIEHILRVHCLRIGNRDPLAWNIACDMTVNGRREAPRIGFYNQADRTMVIPHKDSIAWIPREWPDDQTAEFYYERIAKATETCANCGRGDSSSCKCGQYKNIVDGMPVDDHTTWQQSDVSEDEARQIVKDIADQAVQKSQGRVPGHLSDVLKQLAKPVVRWIELLKHYIGKHVGNKRLTYARRNRRRDEFGQPGVSHHSAADVVVIVDTSRSISKKELQQFFAEIDAISSRSTTHVLQWDCMFQGFAKYRRGDWKRFKIAGRGGTNMAEPIRWLKSNKKVPDVVIMLTDGETNWADPSEVRFPFITVITREHSPQPDYGHVVRMAL